MPIITMGDEAGRLKAGITMLIARTMRFDWSPVSKHAGLPRFVRLLVERRLALDLAEGPGIEIGEPASPRVQQIVARPKIVKNEVFIHWMLSAV